MLKVNIVVGGRFHAEQLYRALTGFGHDVRIYTSSLPTYFRHVPRGHITFIPKPSQLLQKGLKRRMPRRFSAWSAQAFDNVVSCVMRPADVVWGFNGDSLRSGRAVQRAGGTYIVDRACAHVLEQDRVLTSEAAALGYPHAPLPDGLKRRFVAEYQAADLIVVPSEISARSFPSYGVERSKILRAPLDTNRRQGAAPKDLGPKSVTDDFVVGTIGGSFLRKGLIYLLRAVDQMDSATIRLKIRAPSANVLMHQEAAMLCARNHVEFIGYQKDINDFYRSIDCFVLPSVEEGFGMVVMEAMSNGTPVIASDRVGAIDPLSDGENYLRVRAGDANDLKSALTRMQTDTDLCRKLGHAGRTYCCATDRARYVDHVARALTRATAAKSTRATSQLAEVAG